MRMSGELPKKTPEIRLLENINKTDTCWFWTGFKNKAGYGLIYINRKLTRAHRLSYEIYKGEIPKNLVLDHLCRVRHCVNPKHLEAVTSRENTLRGLPYRNTPKKENGLPLGVRREGKRFGAQKSIQGTWYWLGTFDTPEEAHTAYLNKS